MRKREERTCSTSCFNRAADDEMLFVLLGRDVAAPAAVRAWIDQRIRLGKNTPLDPQIVDAEQWIRTVQEEQGTDGDKVRWRTVETAPRDGTRILMYHNGIVDTAWWDTSTCVFGGKGWHYASWNGPTHWMPLPEPPGE